LVCANQGNYFENAIACSKRTLKTTVATQLNKAAFRHTFSKLLGWLAQTKVINLKTQQHAVNKR